MLRKMLYRFELAFSGEPQDVGFLQGLNDTDAPEHIRDDLYTPFEDLPVPDRLDTEDGSNVVFWFTRNGLIRFADAINAIITALDEYNWQIFGAQIEAPPFSPLYEDQFQIAYSRTDVLEYLFPKGIEFAELTKIDTGLDTLLIPSPIH